MKLVKQRMDGAFFGVLRKIQKTFTLPVLLPFA